MFQIMSTRSQNFADRRLRKPKFGAVLHTSRNGTLQSVRTLPYTLRQHRSKSFFSSHCRGRAPSYPQNSCRQASNDASVMFLSNPGRERTYKTSLSKSTFVPSSHLQSHRCANAPSSRLHTSKAILVQKHLHSICCAPSN